MTSPSGRSPRSLQRGGGGRERLDIAADGMWRGEVVLLLLAALAAAVPGPAYPGEEPGTDGPPAEPGVALPSAAQSGAPVLTPAEALSALGVNEPAAQSDREFLHPDIAFVLGIEVQPPDTVVARWAIADTYYLYRDKFDFVVKTPSEAALGDPVMPAGELKDDPYFGRVEVFYREARATIPLLRAGATAAEVIVDVTYQGCTDLGLCYPPVTKAVTLTLPAAPGRGEGEGEDEAP